MRTTFTADNSTESTELTAFASNPGVTLDVTNLDLRRLPQHVKAVLYYGTAALSRASNACSSSAQSATFRSSAIR